VAHSRITTAKSEITAVLNDQQSPVFKRSDLGKIFEENRREWRLPQTMTLNGFLAHMVKNWKMQRIALKLPHRPETLYVWGEVSPFCIASAVKPNGFLSHYTAMYLHGLTEQAPEVIYVNHEQRPQPKPLAPLTQEAIDRVFRGRQRTTKNIAPFGRRKLCVLNGKSTGQLGVVDAIDPDGRPIRMTSLERTLIDITVRPGYSGGVAEVLGAFREAIDQVQVNRLAAMLAKMDYVYPYEQAVGFCMERSGYPEAKLNLLCRREFEFDFYLTYGMKDKEYSRRWRLFFPKGL
jgi:hypothetical protein